MMRWLKASPLAQALNLPRTRLFRALGLVAALLAFTLGLMGGGAMMLQNLYTGWHLQRANSIMVYLPPESTADALLPLTTTLPTLAGVADVRQLTPTELQEMLAPVLPAQANVANLPLPIVAEIALQPGTDRTPVLAALTQTFPQAEIDDQQTLLGRVADSVRTLQLLAGTVALILIGILALFMALTIRAGLLAQSTVVDLLLQLGATDRALAQAITGQTVLPVLSGTLVGTGAAVLALLMGLLWPVTAALLSLGVWVVVLGVPLLMPLVAGLMALTVSLKLLQHS